MPSKSRSEVDSNEFYLVCFRKLLDDFRSLLPKESKNFERDLETFESRVRAEGLSFATKTLPRFAKSVEKALDEGILPPQPSFKRKKGTTLPAFLHGLLKYIFTPEGAVRSDSCWECVRHIRQFCYLVYKLELPYSDEQEKVVLDSFLQNERELSLLEIPEHPTIDAARELLEKVFNGFNPREITPKHGPGAVATGERLEEKWEFSRLYSGIHSKYPYYNYFVVGSGDLIDRKKWYMGLSRLDIGVAKVALVPKDSRGPRLISCEPLEYQWIQQGLNREFVTLLESHPLTKGHVNFSDQSINQRLAVESSTHHFYCTMDMKDASDRVSLRLVKKLFPEFLVPFLMAVRSHATRLPDGREVFLEKYAPMGSAMCFSVEAVVFWALCVAVVSKHFGDSSMGADHVYVYGDDIIVPSVCFDEVVEILEMVGLKTNTSKSFYRGDFRESCGVDAFKGKNVTPTRFSTPWSCRPSDGSSLCAYSSYANDLLEKGYVALSSFLFDSLSQVHGGIPYGLVTSGYPNRNVASVSEAYRNNVAAGFRCRVNPQTQTVEVFAKTLTNGKKEAEVDGWQRLLRNQCQGAGEKPSEVTLPRSVKVKKRWCRLAPPTSLTVEESQDLALKKLMEHVPSAAWWMTTLE